VLTTRSQRIASKTLCCPNNKIQGLKMPQLNTGPCNTKIVCTLGPASSSEEKLEEMIKAGMDVVRLNFSHGDYSAHQELFDRVRKLSKKWNNQVAILADIQGPKIRTGKMKEPVRCTLSL
jgi:pyruvate kinase